jgi:hypothetical protein
MFKNYPSIPIQKNMGFDWKKFNPEEKKRERYKLS